jgi:hypothetical protein
MGGCTMKAIEIAEALKQRAESMENPQLIKLINQLLGELKESHAEDLEDSEPKITQEDVWYHLEELKHLASVASHLHEPMEDGPTYGLEWGELHDNPEREPERWLRKELFPFLTVLSRRLEDAHEVFDRLEEMAGWANLYDQESGKEQELTPDEYAERATKKAEENARQEKWLAAFKAMTGIVEKHPDLAVQIGEAFETDPEGLKAFVAAKAGADGGAA